jgi:hypothetical protein
MATRDEVFEFARQEALRQGVSPELVVNMVRTESGGRINAVSNKGARGPMQLMPATAKELGVDINNWQDNIRGGVRYINQMLNQFGDPVLAVAAYNAGPGAVRRAGGVPNFKETQDYVQKVLGTNMATSQRQNDNYIDERFLAPITQQQAGRVAQPAQDTGYVDEAMLAPVAQQPAGQQEGRQEALSTRISQGLNRLGRQALLTGRYGAEGFGQFLDIGGAPIASLINTVTGTQEALPPSRAISNLLTQAGVPQPQGELEQAVGNITRTGFSALTGLGAGQALSRGAPLVQGQATATQAVGQGLATQPVAQVAGAAAGQGGIEVAQRAFDVQNPLALAGIGLATGAPVAAATARGANVPTGTAYRDPQTGLVVESGRARGVNLDIGDIGEGGQTIQTLRNIGGRVSGPQAERATQQSQLISRTVTNAQPEGVSRGNQASVIAKDLRDNYRAAKDSVKPLFNRAEELAGNQRIPVRNAPEAIESVMERFPDTADANIIMRNVERLRKLDPEGATYKEIRDIQSNLGAELARVTKGIVGGSYNERQQAALKSLVDSLERDVDNWAIVRTQPDGTPVYSLSGAAHANAMEQYRQRVVPFRQDRDIYRVASTKPSAQGYDKIAKEFADNKVVSNTETADLAMNLMSPKGQQATQYNILAGAEAAAKSTDSAQPNVNAFTSKLDLGTPDRPRPEAVILGRNPGLLEEVSTVRDVLSASATPQGQTQSQIAAFGAMASRPASFGAGFGLGNLLGLDPTVSTGMGLAATGASPFLARQAERGLTSLPATRFMLGQPNMGTAGATGIVGGQMTNLYDLLAQPEEEQPFRAELRGMAR